MIEFLTNLDTSVFLALNGAHNAFFDSFMSLFSGRFIWIPMYAMVLLVFFGASRPRNALIYVMALVAAICLTDQICATLIRPAVERLRPSNVENAISQFTYVVNGYRGGPYGFPSCHAANSFALATFIALYVRRRSFTVFIMGWALFNCYTRIYLGVHYPGDILVGAIIGSCFGALCYYAASRFESAGNRTLRAERLSRPLFTRRTATVYQAGSSASSSVVQTVTGPLRITLSDIMIVTFVVTVLIISVISLA